MKIISREEAFKTDNTTVFAINDPRLVGDLQTESARRAPSRGLQDVRANPNTLDVVYLSTWTMTTDPFRSIVEHPSTPPTGSITEVRKNWT